MPFLYPRTIRFQDTDAAGVVYFSNVLAICHEAYEESLAVAGIKLRLFFSDPAVAIPIAHASVDLFQPMFCGDRQVISLTPKQLSNHKFEISYQIHLEGADRPVGKGYTRHVCIDPLNRTRQELPAIMIEWLHRWSDAPPLQSVEAVPG